MLERVELIKLSERESEERDESLQRMAGKGPSRERESREIEITTELLLQVTPVQLHGKSCLGFQSERDEVGSERSCLARRR